MKKWLWEKNRKKALVYDILLMTQRTNFKAPEENYLMAKSMKEIEALHFRLCQYISTIPVCQAIDTDNGNLKPQD